MVSSNEKNQNVLSKQAADISSSSSSTSITTEAVATAGADDRMSESSFDSRSSRQQEIDKIELSSSIEHDSNDESLQEIVTKV